MNGLSAQIALTRADGFEVEVDLEIAHRSTVAVLGPNGAGKSTLIGALAGVLPIDSGRIVIGSDVLDDPDEQVFVGPENRDFGIVFQDYLLFPHLTVADNVGFGLVAAGLPKSEVGAMVDVWLERSGLTDISGKKARELSGGQAQQVAVARAIMSGPRMLVLDEPMAALDATSRVEMRQRLGDHLNDFDGPRLLITHDPTEAFLLADHIYVMEKRASYPVGYGRRHSSPTRDDLRRRFGRFQSAQRLRSRRRGGPWQSSSPHRGDLGSRSGLGHDSSPRHLVTSRAAPRKSTQRLGDHNQACRALWRPGPTPDRWPGASNG